MEALKKIEARFDILVLDIMMPKMDGRRCCSE
jgi:CheY-like chemotaxis protein